MNFMHTSPLCSISYHLCGNLLAEIRFFQQSNIKLDRSALLQRLKISFLVIVPYLTQFDLRVIMASDSLSVNETKVTAIAENLENVRKRIARAAERSGRSPEDIRLVAVTKTVSVEAIREAIAAGVTDVGENYVQDALPKWQEIGDKVRWHFIGHLQSNKAKQAVKMFSLIQSVDSIKLAEEIGKRAKDIGLCAEVLIEVNLAKEASKFGVAPEDAAEFAKEVSRVTGVKLVGLMGMAPFVDNPETVRPYFAHLKKIWDELPEEQRIWLSMGMSSDFETAIEEGSNMVRIGTAIFGPRE